MNFSGVFSDVPKKTFLQHLSNEKINKLLLKFQLNDNEVFV
jgi:hypothetical protein